MTCFRMNNGETLRQYCLKNNVCYYSIYQRIEKGMDIDGAINDYKKVKNRGHCCHHVTYFINDKPISTYTNGCKNKIYYRVMSCITRLHKTPEEAFEMYGVPCNVVIR